MVVKQTSDLSYLDSYFLLASMFFVGIRVIFLMSAKKWMPSEPLVSDRYYWDTQQLSPFIVCKSRLPFRLLRCSIASQPPFFNSPVYQSVFFKKEVVNGQKVFDRILIPRTSALDDSRGFLHFRSVANWLA